MTERQVLKLALEALEKMLFLAEHEGWEGFDKQHKAITAIKEALAQPENCEYCDGTGDVHSIDGEWRGVCICEAGKALAQPEQEPVGWYDSISGQMDFTFYKPHRKPSSPSAEWIPVYSRPTPPQRTWVWLTDEEIAELWLEILGSTPASGVHEDGLQPWRFARAIEAAHGIKGEA